jgi:enterochelin esterase-like enzyme
MYKYKWLARTILFFGLLFTACQTSIPAVEAAEQPTPDATQPPVEVTRKIEETATIKITTGEEKISICSETGVIKRYRMDSDLVKEEIYISVYFPPCYDGALKGGYPIMYLLHGQTFDDNMWLDMGAGQIADEMIISGAARPFLMVFPYEEFYYRNVEQNSFPQLIVDEIIPFVDDTFNVCTERTCRAIGASWSVRIGLQHWDLFASVGAHSLPTFHGDVYNLPDWLANIPENSAPRIYIDTGRFDPEVKVAYTFEQVLNENGIINEWHLNDGRHNTDYWQAHIREYIQWYASGWDNIQ